jgi:hypothetical protein
MDAHRTATPSVLILPRKADQAPKAEQAEVAQSGVTGRVDWLVAVQVSPKMAQERLCTVVLVLHVPPQFFFRNLIRIHDGLAKLRFKCAHRFVVLAFREPLQ